MRLVTRFPISFSSLNPQLCSYTNTALFAKEYSSFSSFFRKLPLFASSSPFSSLMQQHRFFGSDDKIGQDEYIISAFELLGLSGNETHAAQRSPQFLRAAFKRRAKLLQPGVFPGDDEKMKKLIEAYTILRDDESKVQYFEHVQPSIDIKLGILREGHYAVGNWNSENISLNEFLHDTAVDEQLGGVKGALPSPLLRMGDVTQSSFNDFQEAILDCNNGMNVRDGVDTVNTELAPPNKLSRPGEVLKPVDGKSVVFILKLTFDEGTNGCMKTISYEKNKKCVICNGTGRKGIKPTRCVQCHGSGTLKLPSGNYAIHEQCDYCAGYGTMPPAHCSHCGGGGIILTRTLTNVVVPSASVNMMELWIKHKGHDGVRGGKSGTLVVCLMISEHRMFKSIGLDLHAVLPISLSVALLGGYVQVPTLGPRRQLRIPPLAQSGDIVTLANEGITERSVSDVARGESSRDEMRKGDPSLSLKWQQNINYGSEEEKILKKRGNMRYHLVVVVPSGDRLTGRQKAAMGLFARDDMSNISSDYNGCYYNNFSYNFVHSISKDDKEISLKEKLMDEIQATEDKEEKSTTTKVNNNASYAPWYMMNQQEGEMGRVENIVPDFPQFAHLRREEPSLELMVEIREKYKSWFP